jgi:hypothetical protein
MTLRYLVGGIVLVSVLAAAGCDEEKPIAEVCAAYDERASHALAAPPRRTLIFIDQSSSVETGAASPTSDAGSTTETYRSILKKQVKRTLPPQGSRLELRLVHSRTTGAAGMQRYVQDLEAPEQSSLDLETAEACKEYGSRVAGLLRRAWKGGRSLLDTVYVHEENQQATDLWGTLEVVSRTFSSKDTVAAARDVYVFSDMLECMPGAARRCFEHRPPASRQQAEQWAKQDAEVIQKKLRVRPDVLETVTFHFVQGEHSLDPKTQNVSYYWRTLLETMGVSADHIRFS